MADIPKIRFKGFTDVWEQRKLEEVFIGLQNNILSRAELCAEQGIALNVHYGDILVRFGEYLDVKKEALPMIADGSVVDKYKDSFLKNGDVIVADTAEDETVGKCSEIAGLTNEIVISGLHTVPYRPLIKFASGYLGYYMNSTSYRSQLLPLMQGIKVISLSRSAMQNTVICYPKSETEQREIGVFFKNLDYLIALHQLKCDKTKELKKYMLKKMFPQNGKKIPEIRFAGFTDAWEQRKITEIGKIYIGLVTTMTKHYTNEGTLLIRNSDIKDGRFEFGNEPIYLDKKFAEENSSRMHKIGDVITVHTGDVGTSAVITENEVNSIGFATIVTRPNKQIICSEYLCAFLNTEKHKRWAVAISTGDGRTNYNLRDYFELTVPVPNLEEQKRVARFIEEINHLIVFHQHKCNELKEAKKFMLKNMFPQKG